MKGAFKFLWRVVASVWMPPVALVGIVLAIFVEDVLWSKYPALLVRYMLACESSVFGDGVSARYVAAAVVVNSNCRISLVAACVRRLNEAGFRTVYLFTYERQ